MKILQKAYDSFNRLNLYFIIFCCCYFIVIRFAEDYNLPIKIKYYLNYTLVFLIFIIFIIFIITIYMEQANKIEEEKSKQLEKKDI